MRACVRARVGVRGRMYVCVFSSLFSLAFFSLFPKKQTDLLAVEWLVSERRRERVSSPRVARLWMLLCKEMPHLFVVCRAAHPRPFDVKMLKVGLAPHLVVDPGSVAP